MQDGNQSLDVAESFEFFSLLFTKYMGVVLTHDPSIDVEKMNVVFQMLDRFVVGSKLLLLLSSVYHCLIKNLKSTHHL